MPAGFCSPSFALPLLAFFLSSLAPAQQLTTPNAPGSPPPPAKASTAKLTSPIDNAKTLIADAITQMNVDNINGALNDLTQALKLNPNSTGAYVLRASIYCQKRLWTEAEDDFKAAARIAPKNVVLKFQLVDVKFLQKQYDAARPGFIALEHDPDMGDFAAYKVFLCDLFGGHEAAAKRELDVFNEAMGHPSYYFGNAAWSLTHRNLEDARSWLLSASRIYPPEKNEYYSQSLRDLGYLPIPEPNDKVTPPTSGRPARP